MRLYENIKLRREALGLTQEELAKKMGYKSRSSINKIEMGENDIPQAKIEAFAQALDTTPAYLMGWETDEDARRSRWLAEHGTRAEPARHYAPVLGSVRAGIGGLAVQEVVGEEALPEQYAEDGEAYFWLIVVGDSMSPQLEQGDYVLIRSQKSVDSGSVAIVTVDEDEGVVKKVRYGRDWIELDSFNPYYPPRRFEGADVLRIKVMGKVMESKRKW